MGIGPININRTKFQSNMACACKNKRVLKKATPVKRTTPTSNGRVGLRTGNNSGKRIIRRRLS
jgi:hypothetical protein